METYRGRNYRESKDTISLTATAGNSENVKDDLSGLDKAIGEELVPTLYGMLLQDNEGNDLKKVNSDVHIPKCVKDQVPLLFSSTTLVGLRCSGGVILAADSNLCTYDIEKDVYTPTNYSYLKHCVIYGHMVMVISGCMQTGFKIAATLKRELPNKPDAEKMDHTIKRVQEISRFQVNMNRTKYKDLMGVDVIVGGYWSYPEQTTLFDIRLATEVVWVSRGSGSSHIGDEMRYVTETYLHPYVGMSLPLTYREKRIVLDTMIEGVYRDHPRSGGLIRMITIDSDERLRQARFAPRHYLRPCRDYVAVDELPFV